MQGPRLESLPVAKRRWDGRPGHKHTCWLSNLNNCIPSLRPTRKENTEPNLASQTCLLLIMSRGPNLSPAWRGKKSVREKGLSGSFWLQGDPFSSPFQCSVQALDSRLKVHSGFATLLIRSANFIGDVMMHEALVHTRIIQSKFHWESNKFSVLNEGSISHQQS
jgi:hypothetical protein